MPMTAMSCSKGRYRRLSKTSGSTSSLSAVPTTELADAPKERLLKLTEPYGLVRLNRRQDRSSLRQHHIQGVRIDTQSVQSGRRHLGSTHYGAQYPGLEAGVGQRKDHIRVVMAAIAGHNGWPLLAC